MLNNFLYEGISNFIYLFTKLLLKIMNIEISVCLKTSNFSSLAISNHVSELDPFLLYVIFCDYNIKNYKWICDERLKNITIFRKLAKLDKIILINRTNIGIDQINKKVKSNDNIFLFPEGTIYYKQMIKKSNIICNKLEINPYKKVLCPKINGFNTIVKILKPKFVTDITLDYIFKDKNYLKKLTSPLTIQHLLFNPPEKIIITIQKCKIDYIDTNTIMKIFRKKDKFLSKL